MKRSLTILTTVLFSLCFAVEARAQWQSGNLALKTNGNSFQPGDQLRLEALALKAIDEPFSMRVSYSFAEAVKVKNKDGDEETKYVERTRNRQEGPVIEGLKQFQSIVLDDTLHFGEGSPTGRYMIEVTIINGYTKRRVSTLRACVVYMPEKGQAETCPTYVRGLRRANSERWLTFDGMFSPNSRYSAALMQGGKVIKHIEYGVTTVGYQELNISSEDLVGTSGQTYDILIHDHDRNYSSTLERVTIPSST